MHAKAVVLKAECMGEEKYIIVFFFLRLEKLKYSEASENRRAETEGDPKKSQV